MKNQNNIGFFSSIVSQRDPNKVDPTKQDERDNDPTRIQPLVREPDKNDPTQPEKPSTPAQPTEPGTGEKKEANPGRTIVKGFGI